MEGRKGRNLLEHWQQTIGQYVKKRRLESGKVQKELGSRKTISDIENGSVNFTLSTLLDVLEAVDGDISEAFTSRVPKRFHGPHQDLFEMLAQVLETKDEQALKIARSYLKFLVSEYVKDKSA